MLLDATFPEGASYFFFSFLTGFMLIKFKGNHSSTEANLCMPSVFAHMLGRVVYFN